MNSSAVKLIVKILPILIVVCVVAWCTTSKRTLQEHASIRAELMSMLQEKGLIDNSSVNTDLATIAKNIG